MLARTLISRALLLKTSKTAADHFHQVKRNSGHGSWTCRLPPPLPSKRAILIAEVLGGLCWYWILYHIATEPEHIYICGDVHTGRESATGLVDPDLHPGEWPYIDPSTFCDIELGIPPDSEGSLKK